MQVQVFGSTIHQGQMYRGVARAAAELRAAGCLDFIRELGAQIWDHGDLHFQQPDMRAWQPYRDTYERLLMQIEPQSHQLILGGDHSHSLATVPALLKHRPQTGVIWIDAHGDINTPETSLTGQLHGMPLAGLLGLIHTPEYAGLGFGSGVLSPRHLVMIGVRDLDAAEQEILADQGVLVFSREDIRQQGARAIGEKALYHLQNCSGVHVSFDIDALDPDLAPVTGVPVDDGLTMAEARLLMRTLALSGRAQSLEIVEVNPDLAATTWDWEITVEMVKAILGEWVCPEKSLELEASGKFGRDAAVQTLRRRSFWQSMRRQFFERAYFS